MVVRAAGPRARRLRGSSVLAVVCVVLAIAATGVVGCKAGSSPGETSTTLSPMMLAYQQAHRGFVDGPLTPTDTRLDQIMAQIREGLDPDREIWLPEYLPAGFSLAAPYNGDGSGSAYPNPYAWGRGYGVTYTDGAGYVMVLAGSDDDLSQGEWEPLAETVAGRHLRLQRGAGIVLVATVDDGETPLVVSGGGFAGERLKIELSRVAESLVVR